MKPIEFDDGAVQVDATIVAAGLDMAPALFLERLREGKITSRYEHGIDADHGRCRLTFFAGSRRLRLIVDESGKIIQRSTIDYGEMPLPEFGKKSRWLSRSFRSNSPGRMNATLSRAAVRQRVMRGLRVEFIGGTDTQLYRSRDLELWLSTAVSVRRHLGCDYHGAVARHAVGRGGAADRSWGG